MTTPEEAAGLSRRSMLKRSAVVGGTLLWAAPTVTVLTATPAFASTIAGGDGTPLRASYYVLAIGCGFSHYLVKVNAPDDDDDDKNKGNGTKPFTLVYGPGVKGAAKDPKDGWPSSETGGLSQKFAPIRPASDGLPADVQIYVLNGMLYLDLDVDRKGGHCTLLGWTGHKGSLFYGNTGFSEPANVKTQFDPQNVDPGRPWLYAFPLLKNQNGHV